MSILESVFCRHQNRISSCCEQTLAKKFTTWHPCAMCFCCHSRWPSSHPCDVRVALGTPKGALISPAVMSKFSVMEGQGVKSCPISADASQNLVDISYSILYIWIYLFWHPVIIVISWHVSFRVVLGVNSQISWTSLWIQQRSGFFEEPMRRPDRWQCLPSWVRFDVSFGELLQQHDGGGFTVEGFCWNSVGQAITDYDCSTF